MWIGRYHALKDMAVGTSPTPKIPTGACAAKIGLARGMKRKQGAKVAPAIILNSLD
jgi:hypothetical protein